MIVRIKTFLYGGDSEDAKYACTHSLPFALHVNMHVQFVFTTRFEMLSVFIAGQEVLILGDFQSYEHCKGLGDTLWTRKLLELVLPMNKFVTSTCNTI